MRWASYCCSLPVPRASSSYQCLAVFADDLRTKTLATERKQGAKQRGSAGPWNKDALDGTEPSSCLAGKGREGCSITPGLSVEQAQSSPGAHIPLSMGYPLPPGLNLSCNNRLLPHHPLFLAHPQLHPAAGQASSSPGACQGPVSRWSPSGPSWQPLLPADEEAGEVSRWHNPPFIRFVEIFWL